MHTVAVVPGESVAYDVVPAGVVPAPRRAFELSVGAGYTQPWGEISGNHMVNSDVGAGFSPVVELGYRFTPHWSLGLGGQYHESATRDGLPDGSHSRGFALNVDATYHFRPYRFIDPYFQIGTGYRALWLLPSGVDNDSMVHGFELGRAQLGIDYRVSKDVAIGPYVAADLNLFAWDSREGRSNVAHIEDKRVNTFLSAGLMARFDVGGARDGAVRVAYTRPTTYFEARTEKPTTSVTFETALVERCGISGEKAFFKTDSAELTSSDDATLDLLAKCLNTGPLKGREIVIVGRADPRGTEAHNKGLGERRAEAVRDYLVAHGVSASTVTPVSRGEQDAKGTNEDSWRFDRRVDVRLKP